MILTSCVTEHPDPRFEEVCATVQSQWRAACARLGLGREDTEDAVQETWAKIIDPEWLQALVRRHESHSFADAGKFQAYLFIVLRNTAIDLGRRQASRPVRDVLDSIPASTRSPEEETEARQIVDRVFKFVDENLNGEDRLIARMYFAEGLSDEAIAEQLRSTRSASMIILPLFLRMPFCSAFVSGRLRAKSKHISSSFRLPGTNVAETLRLFCRAVASSM